MRKIKLIELMKEDMLEIPEADITMYAYENNKIKDCKQSGIYIFKDGEKVIYIGASNNLSLRVPQHKGRTMPSALNNKLIQSGYPDDYFDSLTIEIILESNTNYQEIIVRYLMEKYSPAFNSDGRSKEKRILGAVPSSNRDKKLKENIIEEFLGGAAIYNLAKKYGVNQTYIYGVVSTDAKKLRGME